MEISKLKLYELNSASVDEFTEQAKLPVAVVLDIVPSMHNIGSIFRTSDGFAAEQICLCGITAQPPHREIEKTALGATLSVNWTYYETPLQAVKKLRDQGYQIIAVEQAENSTMLHEFVPDPS